MNEMEQRQMEYAFRESMLDAAAAAGEGQWTHVRIFLSAALAAALDLADNEKREQAA